MARSDGAHLLDTSLSACTATSISTRAKFGLGGGGPCSAAAFLAGAFFFFGCVSGRQRQADYLDSQWTWLRSSDWLPRYALIRDAGKRSCVQFDRETLPVRQAGC